MADKNPNRIITKLAPKTLRERWNNYWNDYSKTKNWNDKTIDRFNQELIEIEDKMPFKDQEEHDVWSDWLSDYRGSSDLEDLTNAILSRGEENYQGDKADDIIKTIYSTERMPGNEYKAWAAKRGY